MSFYLTHHTSPKAKLIFATSASATPHNRPQITVRVAHFSYPVCLFLLQAPDQTLTPCKALKTNG